MEKGFRPTGSFQAGNREVGWVGSEVREVSALFRRASCSQKPVSVTAGRE
jgi:hypothetical protein